jgi:hypothetical protein
MNLADRVVQYRKTLTARDAATGRDVELNGAARCAARVAGCPLRFVLADDLTRLCAELAYSSGASQLSCADLLHVPAESLWLEWCNAPWDSALEQYGISADTSQSCGRRGALIRASADGRRGIVRTFWTFGEQDVLASSMEAYFDFDTPEGEQPRAPDGGSTPGIRVCDATRRQEDVLGRCFRFRYERSWADYYAAAGLAPHAQRALQRHVLGTVAIDIPLLLAFMLLLASRAGLPRQVRTFERLNRLRRRDAKPPLLDHIEVRAPVLPEYLDIGGRHRQCTRRSPQLHHVRGHLVRRGSQLFWRVPHLRGSARSGVLRARTVTWTFEESAARRCSSSGTDATRATCL